MRSRTSQAPIRSFALLCVCAMFWGCDPSASDSVPPATSPAAPVIKPVLWKRVDQATVVAVDDAATHRALERAVKEARRTAGDARQRWLIAKPAERGLWAVKWAAPLASGVSGAAAETNAIENVWVQPVNWSQFRIEGVLLSSPTAALECGRTMGEMVSFPSDELCDWMHFASEAPDAAFEGGHTVRVLEEKFGRTVD